LFLDKFVHTALYNWLSLFTDSDQQAEDLWDSILDKTDEIQLNRPQQQELDRRLEQHRQDPNAGSTWKTVKQRLGFSR
jgi:putative addiction module component (TIGR02574 family)